MRFALIPLLLTTACACAAADCDWQAYKQHLLQDTSLIRFHTFENLTAKDNSIADLGADHQSLAADPKGQPLQLSAGRFPGKSAVRLDQYPLRAMPFDLAKQNFTAQAWVRLGGPGTLRGNAGSTNGTLLSVGIGYWDGWRLTTQFPDNTIALEMGRPRGINAFGLRARQPATPAVWQHVAVSWDGHFLRLYLNGLCLIQTAYDTAYTQPEANARFVIGYAGWGIGSALFDVDEIAVHNRALSHAEIAEAALVSLPLPTSLRDQLNAFSAARAAQDFAALKQSAQAILARSDLSPVLRFWLRTHLCTLLPIDYQLPLDDLQNAAIPVFLREQVRGKLFAVLSDNPDSDCPETLVGDCLASPLLPAPDRAVLLLHQSYAALKKHDLTAARKALDTLLALPGLPASQKSDHRLRFAHALRRYGFLPEARQAYTALADDTDTPLLRGTARLAAAQTFALQNDSAAARRAYQALVDDSALLPHHRQEAADCVAELDRTGRHLPPHDPEASRRRPAPPAVPALAVFVSPFGDDDAAGTADAPLQTPAAALARLRQLRQNAPPQPAAIVFKDGTYPVTSSLTLFETDSSPEAPLILMAAPGEKPVLSGGRLLRGFISETDPAILSRLPHSDKRIPLLVCDIPADIPLHPDQRPWTELFCDGIPLTLARYPDEGFVYTGMENDDKANPPWFSYTDDHPAHWAASNDIWTTGYWKHLWALDTYRITSTDTAAKHHTTNRVSHYGFTAKHPYFYFNVLEEISRPGEWVIDRTNRKIYLFPSKPVHRSRLEFSTLDTPFITAQKISSLTIHGLTFDLSQTTALVFGDAPNFRFSANTVSRIAGDALTITNAPDACIYGNDFFCLGKGGLKLAAGNRKTLTAGNINIENNWIHDFSRLVRGYTPAIHLSGVGNRIAHNLIHEAPHHAIRLEGNDHLIEYNEAHSVVYESDDQAAIELWGDPSYRGIVMRYNFWHHIGSGRNIAGQCGIRLDDAISGVLMYGNVFFRAADGNFGAIQIHGGKDNLIDNNLFLNCQAAVSFSTWGDKRWLEFLDGSFCAPKIKRNVDISAPPYSTRYPELAHIRENNGVNYVSRSLVIRCPKVTMRQQAMHVVADSTVWPATNAFALSDDADYTTAFTAEQWQDITRQTAFHPIPFAEIGLYPDASRASVPNPAASRQITPFYSGNKH